MSGHNLEEAKQCLQHLDLSQGLEKCSQYTKGNLSARDISRCNGKALSLQQSNEVSKRDQCTQLSL